MHFFDGGCERQKENNVSLCAILVAEKDEDENVFGTNTAAAGNPSEIYVSMYGIFFGDSISFFFVKNVIYVSELSMNNSIRFFRL